MIPYSLHVTVILTVCFLFYKLFLQKATFYGLNRWTLLGCLVLSFILPLLPAPRGWTWVAATTAETVAAKPAIQRSSAFNASSIDPMPTTTPVAPTAAHLSKRSPHRTTAQLSRPATTRPAVTSPAPTDAGPHTTAANLPATVSPPSHPFRTLLLQGLQWLSYVYCLGLLVFGLKFVLQIFLLCYQSLSRPATRDGRCRIVQSAGDRGPCTFGNTIFINPALYDPETFQQILVHEKVHVNEGHTIDILLAEGAVVLQWFNPFAWLYRREVENNLEFLTDRSVLDHPDIERSAYQLSLLRVSAPHLPFSITNNYNQSLLKRRIVMMNSQQSARHTIWKYFVLLPILTTLVCGLNKPAALGQTPVANAPLHQTATAGQPMISRQTATPTLAATTTLSDTAIRPARAAGNLTESASASIAPAAASENTAVTTFTGTFTSAEGGVVTTFNGNILVKPAVTTSISSTRASASSPAVAPTIPDTTTPRSSNDNLHFSESTNIQQGSFVDMRHGSWFLTVDSDDMEFELRAQSGENTWRSSFTVKKSEINPYPGQGTVEFKLIREAGTMTFKGSFDGEQGYGHFQYEPDESYFSELQKMGVEDMDDHTRNSFFDLNIKKDFVQMLNRNGYTPIAQRDVVGLSIHRVDEPFLKYWKTSGVEGTDEVHNLFTLKIMHIDPAYVEELKKAGYTHLTVRELTSLKLRHVDGNYARAINSDASSPVSAEELANYKMMQIDSGYLNSLKKVGYDHLGPSEVRMLSNAHVTAEYIKGFQDAGFSNIPVHELVSLKYRNASPEDAKAFRSAGYTDIDFNRINQLKSAGITPDFVNSFHKIGYDNIPLHILFMLKTSGVDADYVAKMKSKGLNSTDLMKYVQLKRDFN
jgi:beta-lactamase regulating signal transducer with metallopeptidase domain